MLDVIDYGSGNTGSLTRALKRLGVDYRMVESPAGLGDGNPIVLPGVGSFGAVMKALKARGLDDAIREAVPAGRPFLGICVGLQVLFGGSEESPATPGLGLIEGEVVRMRAPKVPQIGWNRVTPREGSEFGEGSAYFVNSYVASPADPACIMYMSDYGGPFCAAVRRANVTAFQFHPEKSGAFGHGLIGQWAKGAVEKKRFRLLKAPVFNSTGQTT